jgi:hypothetical protein
MRGARAARQITLGRRDPAACSHSFMWGPPTASAADETALCPPTTVFSVLKPAQASPMSLRVNSSNLNVTRRTIIDPSMEP